MEIVSRIFIRFELYINEFPYAFVIRSDVRLFIAFTNLMLKKLIKETVLKAIIHKAINIRDINYNA
jgi:AAA+ superfamily predicted ATPase